MTKKISSNELKIWKIGTGVQDWYILTLFDKNILGPLKKLELDLEFCMKIEKGTLKFYASKKDMRNNPPFWKLSRQGQTTYWQFLRSLMICGLIEPKDAQLDVKLTKTNSLDFTYLIKIDNINRKNFTANFIEKYENYNFTYIEDNNFRKVDSSTEKYNSFNNAIYSIAKTYLYFEKNKENKDIKFMNDYFSGWQYWKLDELLEHHNESLIKIFRRFCPKNIDDYLDHHKTNIKDASLEKEQLLFDKPKLDFDRILKTETKSLWDFFQTTKLVEIPLLQRRYVWTTELIGNLFNDIFECNDAHYIGSIITKEKEYNEFKNEVFCNILDGQQRLFSMVIILCALYKSYAWFSVEWKIRLKLPNELFYFFNTEGNRPDKCSLIEHFSFMQNKSKSKEFFKIISDAIGDEKKFKTPKDENSTFTQNYDYVLNLISEKVEERRMKKSEIEKTDVVNETLNTLTNNLLYKILFIQIENKQTDEIEIFKDLNTLSVELSQIDLIKLEILRKLNKDIFMRQRDEQAIEDLLDKYLFGPFESKKNKIISDIKVRKFIAYFNTRFEIQFNGLKTLEDKKHKGQVVEHFISVLDEVVKKDGYKTNALNKTDLEKYLEITHREIEVFESIIDEKIFTGSNHKNYVFSDLLFFFSRKLEVYHPIVAEIISIFAPKELDPNVPSDLREINKTRKILFELERFQIFYKVTSFDGSSLRKSMQNLLRQMIEKIENNSLDSYSLRKLLKKNFEKKYPDIDDFISTLKETNLLSPTDLLSLASRVRFLQKSNMISENPIALTSQPIFKFWPTHTVEHILPQNPGPNLKEAIIHSMKDGKYSREDYDDDKSKTTNKIGNILILPTQKNSSASNYDFVRKQRDIYTGELTEDKLYKGVKLNNSNLRKITDYTKNQEYNFESIEERTNDLCEIFEIIYK